MSVAKKIILLLALIFLTAANAEAAEENDLPFDTLAVAYPPAENEILALIKMKSDGKLGFMVAAKDLDSIGLFPCTRANYEFYLKKDAAGGYPPFISVMVVPRAQRGQVDENLGDWDEDVHIIPIYALFDFKDGQIICEKPFFSASGLNPSHYQGKIQNPNYERLIEVFMTNMPRLHEIVESKGIALP